MCLTVEPLINQRVQDQLNQDGEIRCWKRYKISLSSRHLISPFFESHVDEPGRIVALDPWGHPVEPGPPSLKEGPPTSVSYGIHVYLQKSLLDPVGWSLGPSRDVEVICKKEHFRAAGTFNHLESAVFTEIYLTETEFNRQFESERESEPPVQIEIGNTFKLPPEATFKGGTVVITKVTKESVDFDDLRGVIWNCGKNVFRGMIK